MVRNSNITYKQLKAEKNYKKWKNYNLNCLHHNRHSLKMLIAATRKVMNANNTHSQCAQLKQHAKHCYKFSATLLAERQQLCNTAK